jgi:hypothetical protein
MKVAAFSASDSTGAIKHAARHLAAATRLAAAHDSPKMVVNAI